MSALSIDQAADRIFPQLLVGFDDVWTDASSGPGMIRRSNQAMVNAGAHLLNCIEDGDLRQYFDLPEEFFSIPEFHKTLGKLPSSGLIRKGRLKTWGVTVSCSCSYWFKFCLWFCLHGPTSGSISVPCDVKRISKFVDALPPAQLDRYVHEFLCEISRASDRDFEAEVWRDMLAMSRDVCRAIIASVPFKPTTTDTQILEYLRECGAVSLDALKANAAENRPTAQRISNHLSGCHRAPSGSLTKRLRLLTSRKFIANGRASGDVSGYYLTRLGASHAS